MKIWPTRHTLLLLDYIVSFLYFATFPFSIVWRRHLGLTFLSHSEYVTCCLKVCQATSSTSHVSRCLCVSTAFKRCAFSVSAQHIRLDGPWRRLWPFSPMPFRYLVTQSGGTWLSLPWLELPSHWATRFCLRKSNLPMQPRRLFF